MFWFKFLRQNNLSLKIFVITECLSEYIRKTEIFSRPCLHSTYGYQVLYTIGLLTYLQKSGKKADIAFQWEGKPLWAIAVKINIWLRSSDLNHINYEVQLRKLQCWTSHIILFKNLLKTKKVGTENFNFIQNSRNL